MVRAKPWLMRTYAGHSTPEASNRLFRENLAKGQTGLSVAFDLPTQTGYDPDHALAAGEVGKVGVPVAHLGDLRALFDGIPLETMNTSMTINATAPWLLALYVALAEERGVDKTKLTGTTQNDIVKEYLSRGTFIFPPAASMRLTCDVVTYAAAEVPSWNPINVCSYHLQEAGATPVQELAYALATAISVLDVVKARGLAHETLERVVGRISFFVNAGIRFVEEMCKLRALSRLWEKVTRERYGVTDPKQRVLRYGVQVNSLGLTAAQPENNVIRIVLEMLGVTLSKGARARAVQLPAWNEALGLPRAIDQKWSLRAQQILAFESDLLEYDDLFDGSPVVEAKVSELESLAWAEVERVLAMGGALAAVESGYVKEKLVASNALRLARVERGEDVVVGVNRFAEESPEALLAGGEASILTVDPRVEKDARERLVAWKRGRDAGAAAKAIADLQAAARSSGDVMVASIAAAKAGVTTGEWGAALREVFGEYRAPTGVAHAAMPEKDANLEALRREVDALSPLLGRRAKILVGKPGLDGHSNGAEQIALKARDAGFEVVYEGIRRTPAEIVASAVEEGVHLVGLSILSGSHLSLVPEVVRGLRDAGVEGVPVVVGGIIPEADARTLERDGVARVFTPKDFALTKVVRELVGLIRAAHDSTPPAPRPSLDHAAAKAAGAPSAGKAGGA
jgi:(2R)-ethylmalonyl-CoA mutase